MNVLRMKAWSPYAAGIVVGLLQIPAFILIETALGTSSSYVSAAGYSAALFDSDIRSIDYFEKHMTSSKYLWQGSMVAAIIFGAWLSRKLSGATRESFSPIWRRALGINHLSTRMMMGFIGGFIMLFGARWADGCTSGHGLSGVGQLAVSSIIFTVCFFISGIVIANMFRRV